VQQSNNRVLFPTGVCGTELHYYATEEWRVKALYRLRQQQQQEVIGGSQ
jgi:threonine dehydrogenase-like Zn-dependent dehydrogenase